MKILIQDDAGDTVAEVKNGVIIGSLEAADMAFKEFKQCISDSMDLTEYFKDKK